eukprot:2157627-Amphidinium_carterae.1
MSVGYAPREAMGYQHLVFRWRRQFLVRFEGDDLTLGSGRGVCGHGHHLGGHLHLVVLGRG